ncbi:hypothetical protein ES707_12303 [subsurface metagenome]
MAGSTSVLDKTYVADGAFLKYSVVLYGDEDYHCKAPVARADGKIAGVTQASTVASGDTVLVRKMGITKVIASEAFNKGEPLVINDIEGRVYDPLFFASGDGIVAVAEESAATSGDIVDAWLQVRDELG